MPQPANAAKKQAATPATQKTININLVGDPGESLAFNASTLKDGSVRCFINHVFRDKDGKVTKSDRGATSNHADMAKASAWIDSAVKKALSAGWKRRTVGAGTVGKPDAFSLDSLPKPKGA